MTNHPKVKDLDQLQSIIAATRQQGQRVVHCHGVFDLLHIGHIRYFEQARQLGDLLVVTLTPDRFVDKGPNRPAFPEELRAEAIASLDCVDYVGVNLWPTAVETLRKLHPDVYVKGSEYKDIQSDRTGKIGLEAQVIEELGIELAFTEDIVFSSSNLINRYMSNLPHEINQYLELFRQRHTLQEFVDLLEGMKKLKVLVIGDTILDEYQYCEAIGKSSKDPALAIRYQSHELFAGGVLAVANHVANFAGQVDLVATLGEIDRHEEFIRSQLKPNVTPHFWTQPGAPTLLKRRFIDGYSFNKLLEVYVMDDSGLPEPQAKKMCNWIASVIDQYDLVIAADFGHGTIDRQVIDLLTHKARFLAVNTQANAGNRGFNTISRYPRLDFGCIAEHELRLEVRDSKGYIRHHMERLVESLGCRNFVVTLGRKGCAVADSQDNFTKVPTFAQKIIDRVGAGDAFFAVTAMAAVQGASSEEIGFLGNVVGSLAVEIIGNKKAIDHASVEKYLTALMK